MLLTTRYVLVDHNVCINQVYRDIRSDHQFRLLWIDAAAASAYIYWLGGKASIPKKFNLSELEKGLDQGWIVEDQDPLVLHGDASERDQAFRDAIWRKMSAALLDEPCIYDRNILAEHLHRIEQESGEKMRNLYRHLSRYWERGKSPDTFLPGYKASGGKGKNRGGRNNPRNEMSSEFDEFGMLGPSLQYQIDATVGDIYLVSQFDRSDIIGRPVMYFVMDTVSHIVTGMYIGLEGPSWLGMSMALYNAATDKVDYCHQFGIEITEGQWPCHHVSSVLLGGRGELESHKADNLVTMLGIRVDNAPPYRGDLKPIIESHFRTINTQVKPLLPGWVMPDNEQRGGKDYRLDAKLTLQEFTKIIIGCVLHYNTTHRLTKYEKNEQMLKSGVEAIPVKLWEWGVRNSSGALRTFPKETIRMALMPKDRGSVTEKGIQFKKLYYSCPEAREGLWFKNARKNGRYSVEISYDPRDMSTIYVWGKDRSGPYKCSLLNWEQRFSQKSLKEVEFEQQKQDQQLRKRERAEKESAINLEQMIEAIVDEAEKLTTAAGKTKVERLADIRENRKTEKEAIRKEEAFTASSNGESESRKEERTQTSNNLFEVTEEEWASMSPVERKIYLDVKRRQQ